jgi:uncharacterized protein (TIRG00374 family)
VIAEVSNRNFEEALDANRAVAVGKRRLSTRVPVINEEATGILCPGRRLVRLRTAASFFLGLAILYLAYRRGFDLEWRELWTHVTDANHALLALAFAAFYCSFPVRALRWRMLLGNVGYHGDAGQPMPPALGLTRIMYLAWFANCATIARLGDAYRGYLLSESAGVSFMVTLGTILAERLLDLAVLAVLLSATVLVAFHGVLPSEVAGVVITGFVLLVIGMVGLLSTRRMRVLIERVLPARFHGYYERFEHGTTGSFHRVPLLIVYTVIGWAIECLTLYAVAAAAGTPVSVAGAIVVALVASLLSVVPFTPSGLGVAEVGMVLVLQWMGLDTDAAGAVTILSRAINYWSIVFFGFVLYLFGTGRPIKARINASFGRKKE